MGTGAIFIFHMAEMLFPTLLFYAIAYGTTRGLLRLKKGWRAVLAQFFLALFIAGVVNALFYKTLDNYIALQILVLPIAVSLFVIFFLAPRQQRSAP